MPLNMPPAHPDAVMDKLVCGGCQWYSSGVDGENCRKLRQVELDTPACIEFTKVMPDPYHDAAKDKVILALRNKLRSNIFKIDDSVLTELKGYILNDDFSQFRYGTQQDLGALQAALLKIVSFRARVSQIYTSSLDVKYALDAVLEEVLLWMYSKHSVLMDKQKNEERRDAALNRILPELVHIKKTLNNLMATAKYLDEKLDKNDWTLREILSSLQKSHFKERIV